LLELQIAFLRPRELANHVRHSAEFLEQLRRQLRSKDQVPKTFVALKIVQLDIDGPLEAVSELGKLAHEGVVCGYAWVE
jgi:hypothetical protein